MKKRIMLVGTVLMTVLCSLSVKADKVYYVDPDGNNPENMTVDAVYTTLAAAVSQLTETEPTTIYLKPDCTFSEGDILFEQRADVKIIGHNTTFAGIQNKRILITRAARLELKGITFRNVDYSYGSGGALFFRGVADASSDLIVDSCVFVDNSMPGNSEYINGGVAIATDANDMNVTITNSIFKNNSVDKYGDTMRGAAVLHKGKNGTFEVSNSTFEGNMTVESQSGAMSVGFSFSRWIYSPSIPQRNAVMIFSSCIVWLFSSRSGSFEIMCHHRSMWGVIALLFCGSGWICWICS